MATTLAARPATRWCAPYPFGSGAGAASGSPAGETAAPAMAPATCEVLLQQLAEDLDHGRWRVAIRRFLMLRACGRGVPLRLRRRCELHIERCPPPVLRRIAADVQAWSHMLAPPYAVRSRHASSSARGA